MASSKPIQNQTPEAPDEPEAPPPGEPPAATGGGGGDGPPLEDGEAALADEARRRYLNYAVSVITSRALPDARDGLKPVQRRILYAMFEERLYPDAKFRKSATVVGAVIGRYHPHGDAAAYDALVRMAQSFSLRVPLVDGQGNFGSIDGDSAAAYRYTECKLTPAAMQLLEELRQNTVDTRPNYDGNYEEPSVLPARIPNMLVNGSTGIAVGMATNIPPHNLGEVCDALVALLDEPETKIVDLLKHIKGPDFPTGGQILNSRKELREIYEAGQGAIKLRGEHKIEEGKRGQRFIIITSIPYALNKSALVEDIATIIRDRKLPHLIDVRDESTDDVRVVLEIKKDADPALVMAYLYKSTALQQNFNVNLTCLVPQEGSDVGVARRVDLKTALQVFLDFRFQVVTRRFEHRLAELRARIHILEGFAKIFDSLDEAIKIVRKSDGKADAAAKLMKRFELDDVQVEAILEMKLYKLARLEIEDIREELATKGKEAKKIETILKDPKKVWGFVREELIAVKDAFPDKRRTEVKVAGVEDAQEFSEEQFIIAEDANVVLTKDGWIKRVRELKDPTATRTREGDAVAWVLAASTRENVVFFTNFGTAYVIRANDVPPSTGYGDPVQRLFKFKDNEKVVSAFSLDPRLPRPTHYVAVTRDGLGLRFATEGHVEMSTRAGRKFAKPGEGDEIVAVLPAEDKDIVCLATEKAHVLLCVASEVNILANPGKGVTVINVDEGDKVIGVGVARGPQEIPFVVETAGGKQFEIGSSEYRPTARGGKGRQIITRTTIRVVPAPVKVTSFTPTEVN